MITCDEEDASKDYDTPPIFDEELEPSEEEPSNQP